MQNCLKSHALVHLVLLLVPNELLPVSILREVSIYSIENTGGKCKHLLALLLALMALLQRLNDVND